MGGTENGRTAKRERPRSFYVENLERGERRTKPWCDISMRIQRWGRPGNQALNKRKRTESFGSFTIRYTNYRFIKLHENRLPHLPLPNRRFQSVSTPRHCDFKWFGRYLVTKTKDMPRNRKLHVQVPFDSNHAHNFKTAKSRVKFEPSLLRSLYKLSLWDYPRLLNPRKISILITWNERYPERTWILMIVHASVKLALRKKDRPNQPRSQKCAF